MPVAFVHVHVDCGMVPKPARTRADARKPQSGAASGGSQPQTDSQDGVQYCVSCSKVADDSVIGCDNCERWVCNTVMCSGLPQQMLDAINAYDGSGISFICIKCRISRQNSPTKASQSQMMELIGQMFQQMQGICGTLQGLTEKVTLLACQPKPQAEPASAILHPPTPQTPTQPAQEYRAIIRDEVKEMREREKRRQSIIVKGLKAKTSAELASKFGHMTGEVMGVEVGLSDIAAIPNHANVFRAKVQHDEHRKLVLEKAKNLKDTGFHSVYISRDLTYAQRTELFNRRKSRRTEQGDVPSQPNTVDIGGATAPPILPTPINSMPTVPPTTQGN